MKSDLAQTDHYYQLTSYLAAQGRQQTVTRSIAATVMTLGLLLLAVSLGRSDLDDPATLAVACAVATVCAVMSTMGMRHRWPTRGQSQVAVVIGTASVSVTCFIQPTAITGLLLCTVFAIITIYTVIFHSHRLLAFVWVVAATTIGVLVVQHTATDVATALGAGLVAVITNVFVALLGRLTVHTLDVKSQHGAIEPTTGLLNEQGFREKLSTMIGVGSRQDDLHLIVAFIGLDNVSFLTSTGGKASQYRMQILSAQLLRETVRRDAVLGHLGDRGYFVAEVSATSDPTTMAERVRSVFASQLIALGASIGAVSHPLRPLAAHSSDDVVDDLLSLTIGASHAARAAGGNQYRVIIDPALRSLPEHHDDDS